MIEESTYSKSVFIKLFDDKRTFFYEIIKEETYPLAEQLYYTKNLKHPIPHNYIVRTQYGKAMHTVKCSIEYMEKRPLYKICFGDNFAREKFNKMKEIGKNQNRNQSNRKNKGKISGPLLFGLKLLSVEQVRKTISLDLKIRLFNKLGNSQKRRKILRLSQPYDDIYEINFGKLGKIEEMKKIKAVVKSLDRGHILREAYRSLVRIEDLPHENVIFDLLQPTAFEPITGDPDITDSTIIMNILESIGKVRQHRITDILNYIILLYIEKGILIPRRSTLHIRISVDSRNVRRKVLTLRNALAPLISDLNVLKERGFYQIGGNHWPVELYFSFDWKFLAICLGMKAANVQYFCPWCDCSKNNIITMSKTINKSMDDIKINYKQINGHIKEPLFYMIPLQNWVVDELHIFLRITDRLWKLIISDLRYETADEEIWKAKILLEMQRLNISFQFWHEKNTNNLLYTSLMGPDKLKILKGFDLFAVFQSITRAIQIRAL
ncbi:hypothetical protein C1646_767610 [Rhizophagus diaphanus]|nr:hypothetical protein C1646_767610 [Rhizophagus diaphanus] [Rhizophagus sp. MUCL 43196]